MFALGVLVWTLLEYVIHRWTHSVACLRKAHWFHHDNPIAYSGPSSFWSILIFASLLLVFRAPVVGGMLAGYSAYLVIHAAVHKLTIGPANILYRLKMRHVAHHSGVEANFGVSTSLWDHMFRTEK